MAHGVLSTSIKFSIVCPGLKGDSKYIMLLYGFVQSHESKTGLIIACFITLASNFRIGSGYPQDIAKDAAKTLCWVQR